MRHKPMIKCMRLASKRRLNRLDKRSSKDRDNRRRTTDRGNSRPNRRNTGRRSRLNRRHTSASNAWTSHRTRRHRPPRSKFPW